jgi:hypothetical protein
MLSLVFPLLCVDRALPSGILKYALDTSDGILAIILDCSPKDALHYELVTLMQHMVIRSLDKTEYRAQLCKVDSYLLDPFPHLLDGGRNTIKSGLGWGISVR